MSFLDKAKKQLTGAVDKHGDKIAKGLDKAAAEADKRTKGKYSSQIATGRAKAKEGLDKLDGKRDDLPPDNTSTTYPRTDDRGDRS
jgi:F0F1-type ATP synthase membrane subunit b/b'